MSLFTQAALVDPGTLIGELQFPLKAVPLTPRALDISSAVTLTLTGVNSSMRADLIRA